METQSSGPMPKFGTTPGLQPCPERRGESGRQHANNNKTVIIATSSGITLAPACLISNICVGSENMIQVLQPLSHLDVLRL